MPEFNALLGLLSLSRLEEAATHRNETIAIFQEALGQIPGIGFQQVRGRRPPFLPRTFPYDRPAGFRPDAE